MRKKDTPPAAVQYLRRIGAGALLIGAAGLFPFPEYYWWFVSLIYLGLLAFIIDVLYEKWKLSARAISALVLILLGVLFSRHFVFLPAPLGIGGYADIGNYDRGTNIAGIQWEPQYSEVRISFINSSEFDYKDFVFLVNPDMMVAGVGEGTTLPNVSFISSFPDAEMRLHGTKKDGSAGEIVAKPSGILGGYWVRCDNLPKHTSLQIVLAVENFLGHPGPDGNYIGPKKLAKNAAIKGDYKLIRHPHHVDMLLPIIAND